MPISFNKETRFLFVGDGVTDGNRAADPEGLGTGYVRIIRDFMRAKHPLTAPEVINRGSTGSALGQWPARWTDDVIAQFPDLVTVMIGVNDTAVNPPDPTAGVPLDQFNSVYRQVLAQTEEYLPRARVVLCEPPALWSHLAPHADPALGPYMNSLDALARDFGAECIVPLHSAFVFARRARPDVRYVGEDGHPTSAGHMLIAYTWMESVGIVRRTFS